MIRTRLNQAHGQYTAEGPTGGSKNLKRFPRAVTLRNQDATDFRRVGARRERHLDVTVHQMEISNPVVGNVYEG